MIIHYIYILFKFTNTIQTNIQYKQGTPFRVADYILWYYIDDDSR